MSLTMIPPKLQQAPAFSSGGEPSQMLVPWPWQLARAGSYLLHYGLGFILMLIVMTFSAPLFICIVFGGATGFLLFERRMPSPSPGLHH